MEVAKWVCKWNSDCGLELSKDESS